MTRTSDLAGALRESMGRAIVGQNEVINGLIVAVLCRGHVLLEGVPGTAKTLMARTLAASLGATFTRIQFTPDLLPSDVVGTTIFRSSTSEFEFRRGPIFTDTLLADEINRAPAKTQAALLEAMEESQVTVDGERMPLGDAFIVLATQNPIEYEGTYPLPEAQLDRFFVKLAVPLPSRADENAMLRRIEAGFDPHDLVAAGVTAVAGVDVLRDARAEVAKVRIEDAVMDYITGVVEATRVSPDLLVGASPRAAIALMRGARALAACAGRDYVVPDDVKDMARPALRHRIVRRPEAEIAGVTDIAAVERALARVPVPR